MFGLHHLLRVLLALVSQPLAQEVGVARSAVVTLFLQGGFEGAGRQCTVRGCLDRRPSHLRVLQASLSVGRSDRLVSELSFSLEFTAELLDLTNKELLEASGILQFADFIVFLSGSLTLVLQNHTTCVLMVTAFGLTVLALLALTLLVFFGCSAGECFCTAAWMSSCARVC